MKLVSVETPEKSVCKMVPLDSTHPATGQGLHALNNPKEEVEVQKS